MNRVIDIVENKIEAAEFSWDDFILGKGKNYYKEWNGWGEFEKSWIFYLIDYNLTHEECFKKS